MSTLPADPRAVALPSAGAAFLIRLGSLSALGLFAAMHWAALVRPGAAGELFAMLVVALVTGLALPSALQARGRGRAALATTALIAAALASMLLAAHVPARTLRPDRWHLLADGIGTGLSALPALRVPYLGADPWIRAVVLVGGGLLLLLAAGLTLSPRPRIVAAAICLGTLYTVPIIESGPRHPTLDGALFALLLGTFLWGDRLRRRDAPVAAVLATGAVLIAAIAAPHVRSASPWVDYQALAEALQSGKSTTYTWNQRYGPLHWSRTGLEIARVRSRGDPYLKTASLEEFDGYGWRQTRDPVGGTEDTQFDPRHPAWTQTIHVTIKGLRSTEFLGAGTTTGVAHSSELVQESTPGTFQAEDQPLRRGDAYDARVYVPDPSTSEMARAGIDYPLFVGRQLSVDLPAQPDKGYGALQLVFPPWGSGRATLARPTSGGAFQIGADAVMRSSPYAGAYAVAQQLRAASSNPYEYVRRVIARVQRGARYTESPPSPGRMAPLEAFLMRDHAGYCQHFSGATALLLRMGGVPARVAAGFSPGSREGHDHVLRDYDAHAWVEVYFPGLGWVTFDPTPGDSPARSQQTDAQSQPTISPAAGAPNRRAGDRLSDPSLGGRAAGASAASGGGPAWWIVVLAAGGLALAAGVATVTARRVAELRRSGDPELEELRLALRRSGRGPTPDLTLRRLEQRLGGSDGAIAYVRALRLARYGDDPAGPTPAQRGALRRELGAGLGITGRLRSVWALPPRVSELRWALRLRRSRSYTA